MLRAVVFDMDGTMFNTEESMIQECMKIRREMGLPADRDMHLRAIGSEDQDIEAIIRETLGDEGYELYRPASREAFHKIHRENIELKPGLTELMAYLKAKGFKLGLATSTPQEVARPALEVTGLLESFDAIAYGDMMAPGRGKPQPDIYLRVLEELGVVPEEAVGLEDSYHGVKAVHSAGMITVMIPDLLPPTDKIRPLCHRIFRNLHQVIPFLEQLTGVKETTTWDDIRARAREATSPKCIACPVCNGVACRGRIPGPGGKGLGDSFTENVAALREVKLNLDTIYENKPQDSSCSFWDISLEAPIFAAPIAGVKIHYGDTLTEQEYDLAIVRGTVDAGLMAFTGDGLDEVLFRAGLDAGKTRGGLCIPTFKPWDEETLRHKLALAKEYGVPAVCMDIDAAGLTLLGGGAGPKSVAQLAALVADADLPLLLKGIMTVEGAKKALEAGAAGIVVSNHGGRVLDGTPATCRVLPDIARAVGGEMTVLVDGGIRTGADVFKMLALGAHGVLVGRPYATAAYGGGGEGVALYSRQLAAQLRETMKMTGCITLRDITLDKITL